MKQPKSSLRYSFPNKINWLFRVALLATCTVILLNNVAFSSIQTPASENALVQTPPTQPSSAPSDPELTKLQKEKVALEIEKLRIENLNNERNLLTFRGWINLLFGSGSVIVAIVLGFWGLYRYLQERREELRSKEDERFEAIVKSLGSQHKQERISAASLLPTFLRPEYKRFYVQVFNLAVGNLRRETSSESMSSGTYNLEMEDSSNALTKALVNVFRESYPLARDSIITRTKRDETRLMGRYLNASSVQLNHTYLAGADLDYAWLRESCLQRTTLRAAKLRKANLEKSNICEADLEETDLQEANLQGVSFEGTILRSANLSGARIDATDLRQAILEAARLGRCSARKSNFSGAELSRTYFVEADLAGANLTEANLEKANLTNVDLSGADLTEANLVGTNLVGANLVGADLTNANLERANLTNVDLSGADLTEANLERANLTNADLTGADLTEANLTNATIHQARGLPPKFSPD